MKQLGLVGGLWISILACANAQSTGTELMNRDGKIMVVLAVVLISFVGFITFLWMLERRMNRLEEQIKE
jgi:hypothetical protein